MGPFPGPLSYQPRGSWDTGTEENDHKIHKDVPEHMQLFSSCFPQYLNIPDLPLVVNCHSTGIIPTTLSEGATNPKILQCSKRLSFKRCEYILAQIIFSQQKLLKY